MTDDHTENDLRFTLCIATVKLLCFVYYKILITLQGFPVLKLAYVSLHLLSNSLMLPLSILLCETRQSYSHFPSNNDKFMTISSVRSWKESKSLRNGRGSEINVKIGWINSPHWTSCIPLWIWKQDDSKNLRMSWTVDCWILCKLRLQLAGNQSSMKSINADLNSYNFFFFSL